MIPNERLEGSAVLDRTPDPWELLARAQAPTVPWDDYRVLEAAVGDTETLDVAGEEKVLGVGLTVLDLDPGNRPTLRMNRGPELEPQIGDRFAHALLRHVSLENPSGASSAAEVFIALPPERFFGMGLWGADP